MGYKRRCNKTIQARVPEWLFNDFDEVCKKGYLNKSNENYIKDSKAATVNM